MKARTYTLISSKSVFRVSLLVALLTIVGVFLFGLGTHSTFFENSMLSTTILSIAFFLFITIGLYRGVKLKHDAGNVMDNIKFDSTPGVTSDPNYPIPTPDLDIADSIEGILLAIVLWILWAILVVVILWLFEATFAVVIAAFAAMLYWIFFRAMRLVFKNSSKAKGKIWDSIRLGVVHTVLYNFWIYGILILIAYLKR
jgi:hypothetical protein